MLNAKLQSEYATCLRVKLGAVIVRSNAILGQGCNAAPEGTKNCIEIGTCLRKQMKIPAGQRYEICRSVHAEQNAILNVNCSLYDSAMYIYGSKDGKPINAFPCFICKKMIMNSGITKVYSNNANNEIILNYVEDWRKEWREKDMLEMSDNYE